MERLGRYEILEELGRGAMGRVYRARDPQIDRVVALKTVTLADIDPAMEGGFRQRFFREAKAAGRLSHAGIVTIFDAGEDPESKTPFIVMEYIEGTTLEVLGREKRLPRQQALELIQQVAEALDYAHRQGIIHRDIKPANIIVTPEGRAKITDFGIAKLQTSQLTQTGLVMGTPSYMAPEQFSGNPVDSRADLFSLGTILYWLVTGERPFTGESLATLSFKIVYSDPLQPTKLNPGLGPDYDYVLQRALAKDPGRRYQRGRELADDLDDLKNGRPPRSRAAPAPPAAMEAAAEAAAKTHAPPPAAAAKTEPREPSPLKVQETGIVATRSRRPRPIHIAIALIVLAGVLVGVAWWIGGRKPAEEGIPTQPQGTTLESATPAGPPVPAEKRSRPAATAILQLEGVHSFKEATLSVYADGTLLKQLVLRTNQRSERFSAQMPLTPGGHVISVTVREAGGGTDRQYIEGSFRGRQARTLEVSLSGWRGLVSRGALRLRWVD